MREEKGTGSSSSTSVKFMDSSQVKSTLTKLDKDGDTRRTALNSLKHAVEDMDSASVPRFITQVSETKDTSKAYAIALYEDVARVHGKLIIPHIPRVMSTVTRTLSSSGSSPQLHQACAKVISAVVKHAIGDDGQAAQAADILREICNPLLEVLTGRLEPLAAGAAMCLQTLAESEKWNYASPSLVEDLCLKTTVALAEKNTRTVAHMQLASSLASTNSSYLGSYGVTLLRSGAEVLRGSAASAPWQLKSSAARLLTAVLPTVDRATLAEELSPTVVALENCKHDRMSNVRWAVKDALKAAKDVLTVENIRRSSDGDDLLSWMNPAPEPSTSSPRRRSTLGGVSSDDMTSPPGWNSSRIPATKDAGQPGPRRRSSLGGVSSDDMVSPPEWTSRSATRPHRTSPVSSVIPLSPSAPSGSPRLRLVGATALASDELPHRPPLQATRLQSQVGAMDNSVHSYHDTEPPRKENLPSQESDGKTGDRDLSPTKAPASEGAVTSPSLAAPHNSFDSGMSPAGDTKLREEHPALSPDPLQALIERQLTGNLLTEEDMFLSSNGGTSFTAAGLESERFEMRNSRGSDNLFKDLPTTNGGAPRGVLNGTAMKHVFELKGPVTRSSPRSKDDESVGSIVSPARCNGDSKEFVNGHFGSPLESESPLNLAVFDDAYSPQNKPVLVAEDFLPFSTPRRLVRSLQDCFSSAQLGSSATRYSEDSETRLLGEIDVLGERMTNDMDLGTPTSTSTGWSVRTNPIASDESLRSESDDSDNEQKRRVWKKMVLEPATSPTPSAPHTPPAQETDNPDLNDGFRHRIEPTAGEAVQPSESAQPDFGVDNMELLARSSSGENVVEEPDMFNELDAKRMSLGEGQLAVMQSGGSTLGVCVDNNGGSCSDTQCTACEQGKVAATSASEITADSEEDALVCLPPFVESDDDAKSFDLSRKGSTGWRERLSSVLFSWQMCVVMVALPFAIVMSKVAFPSDSRSSGLLVPT